MIIRILVGFVALCLWTLPLGLYAAPGDLVFNSGSSANIFILSFSLPAIAAKQPTKEALLCQVDVEVSQRLKVPATKTFRSHISPAEYDQAGSVTCTFAVNYEYPVMYGTLSVVGKPSNTPLYSGPVFFGAPVRLSKNCASSGPQGLDGDDDNTDISLSFPAAESKGFCKSTESMRKDRKEEGWAKLQAFMNSVKKSVLSKTLSRFSDCFQVCGVSRKAKRVRNKRCPRFLAGLPSTLVTSGSANFYTGSLGLAVNATSWSLKLACHLSSAQSNAKNCVNAQSLFAILAPIILAPVTLSENLTTTLFDSSQNPSTLLSDIELTYAMSITGDAVVWSESKPATRIGLGGHIDRVVEALFLFNPNVTSVTFNVQQDLQVTNQCQSVNTALVAFITKASVRGCGSGRSSLPVYKIALVDSTMKQTLCFAGQTTGLQRRTTGVTGIAVGGESSNAMDLGDPPYIDGNEWRPVSDLSFTPPAVYRIPAAKASAILLKPSKDKSKSLRFEPYIKRRKPQKSRLTPKRDINPLQTASSQKTRQPGPVLQPAACPANTPIVFELLVSEGNLFKEYLKKWRSNQMVVDRAPLPELEMPIYSVSSPILVGLISLQNIRGSEKIFLDSVPMKGQGEDYFYKATFIPARPILGHVLIHFSLPSDSEFEGFDNVMYDISIVCGASSSDMATKGAITQATKLATRDSDVPTTWPLMVWNIRGFGEKPGKTKFLETFAKKFEVGIWVEAVSNAGSNPTAFSDSSQASVRLVTNKGKTSIVTLYSNELGFAQTDTCEPLPVEMSDGRVLRPPCAVKVQRGQAAEKRDAFFVIPVHWNARDESAEFDKQVDDHKLQLRQLFFFLEYLRVGWGLPILVAGDFNQEAPLIPYSRSWDLDDISWFSAYRTWGVRPMPHLSLPTKLEDQPKRYDYIWDPYSVVETPRTNVRWERSKDFGFSQLPPWASLDFCPQRYHRTMSREFSDHHPIIFNLQLPSSAAFTLLSFNLKNFKQSWSNPFNDVAMTRKRGEILTNYVKNFHFAALQEVSNRKANEIPALDKIPVAENEVSKEFWFKQWSKNGQSEFKRSDQGNAVVRGDPKSTAMHVECNDHKISDVEADIRICLVEVDIIEGGRNKFWAGSKTMTLPVVIGSVHDSATGTLRLANTASFRLDLAIQHYENKCSEYKSAKGFIKQRFDWNCDERIPVFIVGK
ncbi:hypothetical protein BDZ88DRAFT_469265 [Geranomyces variabilis]|nr:hypothetical protein BDZ88DRAFT_469265 [Geranomyces variabilis]